ncbi:indolepyruvate ferredoxin oxidoreductase [Amycolatopsis mediterranei S699]|uniref:Indolepyruvate ferredoxin oxidoreductase n=4 Tax=Amycolatopsis mediterranei TaxID=33910 RepID=A0A0H3DC11_AMYMU|nr:indolepyruvate ferredoxin oxidoreductase family protein [Amycolatopsis mediterranei]ADJ47603.1 indolepyruvate ferredoxin oxidoreductase [Amycolatopsis mediterranei U32]AEK44486.1 indolepyruvate ferredoxin oxidoreductase [Amycolatopsis mediterranei S699]AFO79315.1 indolepyruvate ferredoxin oxidoreductase [Amycolatopsis mediterranei S699]AGT86443.1 indolepyruvate ferredoxin oxidoreductase [Amycolatopsis mediterranei RB]KDO11891.1 2-oxoacid ferredoxin oxidoreductase [Amycolatopsis mediterranei
METFTLEDRYLREAGTVHLTGVQALVRLLFDRVRHDRARGGDPAVFVSGYEGSPLAGYDLELGRRATLLQKHDVVHRPGLNEELAATSVMGSQLVAGAGGQRGVTGFWYGKAPGLDRASDALRHANLAGTDPRGGAVALVGDDPNAKSSTVPCASELALADLAIPVLFPADAQDVLDLGMHAVELSRASGLWTSLKIVANVADASGTATVSPQWTRPEIPGYRHKPTSRLLGASLAELERSLFTVRLPLALEYLRASGINRITRRGPADRIGIVAAGKSYLDLQQAVRILGLDGETPGIRILKLGAIHPLEPTIVREFADGLDEIVVVEEKRAFVETALKEILYGRPGAPKIAGKKDHDGRTLFTELGELDPDGIAAGLARILPAGIPPVDAYRGRRRRERIAVPLLARTPYFCSGCPHNSSTKVPEGTLVGAGIGCHTMALFMEPDQVGTVLGVTQMGGEGTQWIGMAPFVEAEHFVQNIGDGTFTHSGSLAVRAAVAAGVNITYKLLYNSTVAMTGGQDAVGGLPVEKVAELLLVEGAKRVVITSDAPAKHRKLPAGVEVRDRGELLRTQEELAAVKGVTVLIHEQECAAEKRRKRRRGKQTAPATRVVINERVCEGCGDCGTKSNCLSVQPVDTEFGRKTAIHQSSCNVDYSCLAGDCPSFVTVVPTGRKQRRKTADLAADVVPAPENPAKDFTVRITGIGGTGVVTVTQILATAAVLDGRHVRTLDQTGLAQKGGAVVSDLKVTAEPVEQAPKLAAGECDLYLACDALVGADAANLGVADPARTTAVVSTTEVPTGRMVVDTTVSFPDPASVLAPIDTAAARTVSLDARGLAEEFFDDDQFANVLQLGAAYQTGAIPLPASAIERAIELNGTQVAANVQAFRRGRLVVAAPGEKAPAPKPAPAKPSPVRALVHAEPGSELARLLDIRIPELVAYQDQAYARAYAEFVERVRVLEDGPTELTEAVAKHLYKLMAYKDEYEVARLSLDPALTDGLAEQFGAGTKYAYRLHPPVLRALGMRRKISLGPWFRPAFRLLHALRRLRGTRFDPFGRAEVRKVERELIEDYRSVVLQALRAGDVGKARALAELPDLVRGYEDVKLANVARYRQRQAEVLTPAGS